MGGRSVGVFHVAYGWMDWDVEHRVESRIRNVMSPVSFVR